jgi:hypothetical protein
MKHFFEVLGEEHDEQVKEVIVNMNGTWTDIQSWLKIMHVTQNDVLARRKGDKIAMNILPLQVKRVYL